MSMKLDFNGCGSTYEGACDDRHHGHAHARASFHCDHEDGYAYLRCGNTFAFTSILLDYLVIRS